MKIDVIGDLNTSTYGDLQFSSPRNRNDTTKENSDRRTAGATIVSGELKEPSKMTSLGDVDLNQTTVVSEMEHDLTKSFMESHLGGIDPTKRLELLKTAQTTYHHQINWQKRLPNVDPIINLDTKCLNCSDDV